MLAKYISFLSSPDITKLSLLKSCLFFHRGQYNHPGHPFIPGMVHLWYEACFLSMLGCFERCYPWVKEYNTYFEGIELRVKMSIIKQNCC